MNTKKIWIISLILGLTVAGFSYLTVFPKENVTTAAEGTVSQENEEKKEKKDENADKKAEETKKAEKEKALVREFTNPIVEVSKGKRAISLKINLEQGVSGYVAPNSMVDVIAYETMKDDATKKEFKSAVLVLENVKVLTSGKSSSNKEEALHYETVTLEVSVEEGIMLGLASKDKDGFYLMLRNTEDTQTGKAGLKQTREVIKEEAEEKQ
jgi:pilus assembly protein CpaB